MPILPKPEYRAPFWQFNGHMQSIFPSMFRKVTFQYTKRERVELPDGDFLDIDWAFSKTASKELVIITHGLEGDSGRHYVTGMAKSFTENGIDALGWNCRSCSGEMNRLLRFYHHGDASDLSLLIKYAIEQFEYESIYLVGFSMGGSLTIRAIAEFPENTAQQVKKAVAFSVPCDLAAGVVELSKPGKTFYTKRFLKKLGRKIKAKEAIFPGLISYEGYENIKEFTAFDDRYTAPLHGYASAADFYAKASVKPLLPNIRIPTLLVQALNDPFLSETCIGYEAAKTNPNLFLETPSHGGHCGFMLPGKDYTWAEKRAIDFVLQRN